MNKRIITIIAVSSIILVIGIIIFIKVTDNKSDDSDELTEEDYWELYLKEELADNNYRGIPIEEKDIGDIFAQITLKEDGKPVIQVGKLYFELRASEKYFTLAHELGHLVLGHFDSYGELPDDIREFEADLFALNWTGIDPYDFGIATEFDRYDDEEFWNLYAELWPYVSQMARDFAVNFDETWVEQLAKDFAVKYKLNEGQ